MWNVRLVHMVDEEYPDQPYIEAREVYYDAMGKPMGHCPASVGGETIDELKQYVQYITEALTKPILKFKDSK